jgi:CHASE3 domain sensor protein
MSSMWRSILTFVAIVGFLFVLGIVFFAAH